MDESICQNLVAVIRRYSCMIKVKDADGFHAFTDLSGSQGRTVPVRCLTLTAAYRYGNYPAGHEWHIALRDIRKTIRRMASADREFMWRVRRRDLSRGDVERIILKVSHGIIRLNLL